MKDHAKVGKRKGRPTYRSPWSFRAQHVIEITHLKSGMNKKKRS